MVSRKREIGTQLLPVTGARQVTFTDREPLALQCALRSARACGLEQVQPLDTALRDGFQGEPAEDPAKSFLVGRDLEQIIAISISNPLVVKFHRSMSLARALSSHARRWMHST